ncbi:LysE family translocator [Lacisediminihabitans profunda]|uniref:LysE family translocator n=1 Tax=Lacisediminihabitans profunda TaxID=2594790 RepID=A0A5C8ULT6_9MICO|nr:LysE family translocator [Lacisediminihabitans profunda]TXN29150.1 LysE family translocator [Lacisediminihabitans profunda]
MTLASFAAFSGLCVLLAVTPGPDTFLALRFSMARRAAGIASGLGSSVGSIAWAALVAAGLAALLEQSAELYRVVKIVGGLYLVYLGISTFIRARRSRARSAENRPHAAAVTVRGLGIRQAFAAGMASTLLNPKVGLFFLAIVPQFVPAHQATAGWTLILGVTFAVIGGIYLTVIAFVASRVTGWLNRPAVTKWLERISSGVLAALGIGTIVLSAQE